MIRARTIKLNLTFLPVSVIMWKMENVFATNSPLVTECTSKMFITILRRVHMQFMQIDEPRLRQLITN